MNRVSPFLAGLLFGLGLCLSGMTDPQKVLGFLDLAGSWDPSLAFVMVGAIVVAFVAFRIASRRAATFSGHAFQLPTSKTIDARLEASVRLAGRPAGGGPPADGRRDEEGARMTNAGSISQAARSAARNAWWRPVPGRVTLPVRLRWRGGLGLVLVRCRGSWAWSTGPGLAWASGLAR